MSAWTGAEIVRLRAIYRDNSRSRVEGELSRHSWPAICAKAQALGLTRPVKYLHPIDPIVDALVQKRKRLGVSQGAAAEAIGVYRATLSRYERGRRLPHLRELLKWCDLLQMRISIEDGFTPSNDDRTQGRAERRSLLNHTSVRP